MTISRHHGESRSGKLATACATMLLAACAGPGTAWAGSAEDEAEERLSQRLAAMEPALPCPVSDLSVEASYHGANVAVTLAESGCGEAVARDATGKAPADTAVYRAVLAETRAVIDEGGLGQGRKLKITFAVHGWLASVDLKAYAAAVGTDEQRLGQSTTWYPKPLTSSGGTTSGDGAAVSSRGGRGAAAIDPATLAADLGYQALTMDAVTGSLTAMQPAYAACRDEQQRADGHEIVGQVVLRVTVRTTGKVTRVRAVRSTVASIPLENCLVTATGALVFPPSPGGEQFRLDWPVDFE